MHFICVTNLSPVLIDDLIYKCKTHDSLEKLYDSNYREYFFAIYKQNDN